MQNSARLGTIACVFWRLHARSTCLLQEWCRDNCAECLAVQPPGRNMRMKEDIITSPQDMAQQLLPVVGSRLATTPYIVREQCIAVPSACCCLVT